MPTPCGGLVPWLRGQGVAGGLFGPRDGRIDGPAYCQLLAGLAEAGGARIRTGVRMRAAGRTGVAGGSRPPRARSTRTSLSMPQVHGRPQIGVLLGVDVPVIPLRNQIGIWRLERPLGRVMPMVMDYIPHTGTRGLYVATYDDADHVLAGLHSEEVDGEGVDPDAYDQGADDDYLADTRAALERRMPDLAARRGRAGVGRALSSEPGWAADRGSGGGRPVRDPRRGRRRLGHPAVADHGRPRGRLDRARRAALTLRRSPCRTRPWEHGLAKPHELAASRRGAYRWEATCPQGRP